MVLLAGCATPVDLIKDTLSGYPEAEFKNSTTDTVKSKLMEGCSNKGILVQDTQPNSIVCGKRMTGNEAFLATLLIGNKYSTPPERKIRFIIYQKGQNVRVTAQQWIEVQMAFGQIRREELNSNNQRNEIQEFLTRLGGR